MMETDMAAEMEDEFSQSSASSHPIKTMLNQVERQVNQLFVDAKRLMETRDSLLETLHILQNEQSHELSSEDGETVTTCCENLVARCLQLDVSLSSERAPDEVLALHMINNYIDKLVTAAHHSPLDARATCHQLMTSMKSVGAETSSVDGEFVQLAVSCSDADRDVVSRRLRGLMCYIDAMISQPLEID